ncbi:MAG: LysR family transcriptional regulator [Bacteroidales bacterium]|nr:LysR family transcriptional regulator [Bacteroidales bacterium]
MELRKLKYFVKVAEMASFSEASKALNVTQSTLSQQIKQLEDELESALFIRDSRHVTLTDVGQAYLPTAQKILADADQSLDLIRNVKGLVSGTLNIGTTYTFSPILGEMVLAYTKQFPGVHINICCHPVDDLMQMLDHQELDIVFSYRPLEVYENIESYSLFYNRLSAVMADTHPLSSRKSLYLSDLTRCTLALPAAGMQARNVFDSMTSNRSDHFKIQIEVNEISMLLDLVASSHMVTLVSHATIKNGQGLVSIPIEGTGCRMDGCYHIKNGVYMKYAAREFVRITNENKDLTLRKLAF